ncbi:MAG: hypothetical protein V9H26_03020 [Verrucomicrobiota bacterium]
MQAHFLLGPAGSGKTFRCRAEIRAALLAAPDGPPLILLAPKQATFQFERQLLADPALPGYTRLHIFSFERLAQFVLDRLRLPPPTTLSEEGRVMVLRALLRQNQGELQIFRAAARLTGFAQQLSLLLREFQRHRLSPSQLAELSTRPDNPTPLRAKLHDLALLLHAYGDWLAAHDLRDANHLLDVAASALRPAPSALRISGLWLDGFAEMTPQELELLVALLPLCEQATLAFCLEGEHAGRSFVALAMVGRGPHFPPLPRPTGEPQRRQRHGGNAGAPSGRWSFCRKQDTGCTGSQLVATGQPRINSWLQSGVGRRRCD